jgi:DNA helicase-2/ATP-dependent DNA helicase PcrA
MEEALRKLNIPYRIYGGMSFYQRKEIKDILAYFRLSANPKDEEALKRIINYPRRGIGNTTIDELTVAANHYGVSMWEVITEPHSYPVSLNAAAKTKVQSFATMIKSFTVRMESVTAFDLAQEIAQSSGILRELHEDKSPEGVSRYENIQELLNALKDFTERRVAEDDQSISTLSDFLIDVALLTDADQTDDDHNKIAMMTIHAAKGLEFPYVFMPFMTSKTSLEPMKNASVEQQARIFFVAATRAKERLHLSYHGKPHQFIDDIRELDSDVVTEFSNRKRRY